MQTITYDPATHVLLPRLPDKEMVAAGLRFAPGMDVFSVSALFIEMMKVAPSAPQSSSSNNSNSCREALKWTAAGFKAFAKMQRAKESDRFELDDGTLKSIGEILDMADAALEQKS